MFDNNLSDNEAYQRWIVATSSKSPISHKIKEEMTEAGLEVIRNDQSLSECLGDRTNEFAKQVKPSLLDEANLILEHTTRPNNTLYAAQFRNGNIQEHIWHAIEVFPRKEELKDRDAFKDLAGDYKYLDGISSHIVDAMAKTITKHAPEYGIGFTHPADIAKYQP